MLWMKCIFRSGRLQEKFVTASALSTRMYESAAAGFPDRGTMTRFAAACGLPSARSRIVSILFLPVVNFCSPFSPSGLPKGIRRLLPDSCDFDQLGIRLPDGCDSICLGEKRENGPTRGAPRPGRQGCRGGIQPPPDPERKPIPWVLASDPATIYAYGPRTSVNCALTSLRGPSHT